MQPWQVISLLDRAKKVSLTRLGMKVCIALSSLALHQGAQDNPNIRVISLMDVKLLHERERMLAAYVISKTPSQSNLLYQRLTMDSLPNEELNSEDQCQVQL